MLLALIVTLAGVSVSGRVVDAETNAPIPGARVVLAVEATTLPPATSGDEAVTDKDGRFVFPIVEPGRYRLDAIKKGFAPFSRSAPAPLFDVGETPVEGLELALTKGASISGRIVEPSGAPQPRLSISALKVSDFPSDLSKTVTAQTTETAEDGGFVLRDLADGSYLVMAAPGQPAFESSSSGALLLPSPTYYPGTLSKEAAQIITLAQGQTISDLQFSILSARGYQISGVVVDGSGAPVHDASVVLVMEAPGGGISAPAIGLSDGQGFFQLEGVSPGTYRVVATVIPGITPENSFSLIVRGGPTGSIAEMPGVPVRITDGNVGGLRIVVAARR